MAKHGKGRFRPYVRGSIDHKLNINTLAGSTVVGSLIGNTVVDRTYLSSVKAAWSLDGVTKATDVGPLMVGIAHSDYSDTEVEEWIESLTNWDAGNLTAQEKGRRKIRMVGVFTNADEPTTWEVLNDGKPITTKCKWILFEGDTVRVWAYNMGPNAFSSTVPHLRVQGHANLWPQ